MNHNAASRPGSTLKRAVTTEELSSTLGGIRAGNKILQSVGTNRVLSGGLVPTVDFVY